MHKNTELKKKNLLYRDANGVSKHPDCAHGTVTGYTNYYCRCGPCGSAWSQYYQEWKSQKQHNLDVAASL